jgi:hypothetical protein
MSEGHTEFFNEEYDMIIAGRASNVYAEQVQGEGDDSFQLFDTSTGL